jgi:hypothetical protein
MDIVRDNVYPHSSISSVPSPRRSPWLVSSVQHHPG